MTNLLAAVLAIVAAYVLHELGHFLAAEVFGIETKGFVLCRRGLGIVRERGPVADCLVVALAGPLTNLLLAIAWGGLDHFVYANLCLGVLNLWPWEGSDGARALSCWREIKAKRAAWRRPGVDDRGVEKLLAQMQAGPVIVSCSSAAEAEAISLRIFKAGGDLRRLTISRGWE